MARVEEGLKHQRELLIRIQEMDKRFEALTQRLDRSMRWSFGVTISTDVLVVANLRLTG